MNHLRICSIALAFIAILPACGKKDAGCKLDSECPNGQICRNMKCEADPANTQAAQNQQNSDAAKDQAPDAAKDQAPAADAKPTTPQPIALDAFQENKTVKLEDLGLDIDYILDTDIHLNSNTKLEIGPGVTIDMQAASAGISVNEDAALIVKGTAESPVIFKSTNNSAWDGLHFSSKNKDNAINYLQVLNADGESQVIELSSESRLAIDHLTLDGSANNGIDVGGDAKLTKFTNNTIKNCKGYPLVLSNYAQIAQIGDGNKYENNKQFIRINSNYFGDIQTSVIKKQPIPYFLADGINADGESGTLTIEPGVEFVFEHEKDARIGGSIQIKIEGTAENPVIMRGLNDEPNFWYGLNIDTTRPSSISGLQLANTGCGEYASLRIRPEAVLTISNIIFKATDHRCLEIGSDAKITNNGSLTFEKCGTGNIFDNRIDGDDEQKVLADLPVNAAE